MARVSDRRKGERRKGERRLSERDPPIERRAGSDRRIADRRQVVRRQEARVLTTLRVDYRDEQTFLFAYATNVSSLGIFVQSLDPRPPGTQIDLVFGPADGDGGLTVRGQVVWVNPYKPGGDNPNPGMGIRFLDMDQERRERLLHLVRRIAYIGEWTPGQA